MSLRGKQIEASHQTALRCLPRWTFHLLKGKEGPDCGILRGAGAICANQTGPGLAVTPSPLFCSVIVVALTGMLYYQVGSCWVTGPASGRPKATVHFLGGAFAGASPQLAYPLLIQMLAQAGYTVVSTPYAVTFKHIDCAAAVQRASIRFFLAVSEPHAQQPLMALATCMCH